MRRVQLLALLAAVIVSGGLIFHLAPVQAQAIPWPEPPYFPTNISFSSSSAQTLVAAPAAGGVCVYGLTLINAGGSATTVSVYLDGGTTAVYNVYLAASGGAASWQLLAIPKNPYFISNAGQGFVIKSSAVVQIDGGLYSATCP